MAKSNPFLEVKESTIAKRIIKALREDYPGTWYNIHGGPYQERGIPDIVGCYKGTFCGIEVKKPNKRANTSSYQKVQLESIKSSGGLSGVVTSVKETKELMDEYFKEPI